MFYEASNVLTSFIVAISKSCWCFSCSMWKASCTYLINSVSLTWNNWTCLTKNIHFSGKLDTFHLFVCDHDTLKSIDVFVFASVTGFLDGLQKNICNILHEWGVVRELPGRCHSRSCEGRCRAPPRRAPPPSAASSSSCWGRACWSWPAAAETRPWSPAAWAGRGRAAPAPITAQHWVTWPIKVATTFRVT